MAERLTDSIHPGGPRAPHPKVGAAQQQKEEAGRGEQEHGQVVGAEAAGGGHLVPFELLEQLVLRDAQLGLHGRLAVRVVGSGVVGVVGPVGLGQAAVAGEARSQADAEPAAPRRCVLAVDVVVAAAAVSAVVLGERHVHGLPGKVVAPKDSRRARVPSFHLVFLLLLLVVFFHSASHHASTHGVNLAGCPSRPRPSGDTERSERHFVGAPSRLQSVPLSVYGVRAPNLVLVRVGVIPS